MQLAGRLTPLQALASFWFLVVWLLAAWLLLFTASPAWAEEASSDEAAHKEQETSLLALHSANSPVYHNYLAFSWIHLEQKPGRALASPLWGATAAGFNQGESFSTQDLWLRLGGRISDHFATELRWGKTFNRKTSREPGSKGRYKNNHHYGGYLLAGYPIHQFQPYVVVGHTWGKRSLTFSSTAAGDTRKGSQRLSSFSYGLGLNWALSPRWVVNAEYLYLYPNEDVKAVASQLGLAFRF